MIKDFKYSVYSFENLKNRVPMASEQVPVRPERVGVRAKRVPVRTRQVLIGYECRSALVRYSSFVIRHLFSLSPFPWQRANRYNTCARARCTVTLELLWSLTDRARCDDDEAN